MDYKVILNLMKEMNNTDLTKLEIEEEGIRICIEKAAPSVTIAQPTLPQVHLAAPVTTVAPVNSPATLPSQTVATNDAVEKHSEEVSGKKLVSPMVGTFYAQASPDKPAFVKVGDKVKKGQTICIIEAMKLMNEIESEFDGEIVKVLMKNEEMVEFGQPLFLIK
ncbi:MAG: acetyl-CoA carboxylase biotin carboxyl carrier protein [Mobilitalea sp.]